MRIGGAPPQMLPGQDPSVRASDRDAAFGFDELGVFGLKGRFEGASVDRAPIPPPVDALLSQQPAEPRLTPVLPLDPERPSASSLPMVQPLAGLDGPGPISSGGMPANEPELAGGGLSLEMAGPIADGDGEAAQAEETTPPTPAPTRDADTRYGLAVSIDGNAASIAVKAPPLDADGRALLRRLLRQLLAERRLSLADFQLNGAAFAADFLPMTGGSHGPRPR